MTGKGADSPENDETRFFQSANDERPEEKIDFPEATQAIGDLSAPIPNLDETFQLDQPQSDASVTSVGPYKLVRPLGEGGMGSVWLANQESPVRRQVAVKLIKAGLDSKEIVARFEAERQALAMMNHPNIAKVLDAGTTADGQPYFVMELVDGVPIHEFCDERRLSIEERLKLFVPVCEAIQHAHQKGIIHRDLKPSNVLVSVGDGVPTPKVIDFGLAKALQQSINLTDKSLETRIGQVVGTIRYMSPEQAGTNHQDIDTRADVYSLGVMLYELVVGSTPLDLQLANHKTILEVLSSIREREPPRPSDRLANSTADEASEVSTARQIDASRLRNILQGDLDWIVMKALEKDRDRRYSSANGFGSDIQNFLANAPVAARPPSKRYLLSKFVKRNKGLVAAVLTICVLLVVGVAISTWFAIAANRARSAADEAAKQAIAKQKEADQERKRADLAADQARGQSQIALSTLTSVINDSQELRSIRGGIAVQRKILNTAAKSLENIAVEHVGTQEVDRNTMIALANLGKIYQEIGTGSQSPDSDSNSKDQAFEIGTKFIEQALAISKRLATNFPSKESRTDLAVSFYQLALAKANLGKTTQAIENLRRARKLFGELLEEYPAEPKFKIYFAEASTEAANQFEEFGDLASAQTACRESLQVMDRMIPDNNQPMQVSNLAFWQTLAKANYRMATILYRRGEASQAKSYSQTSFDIRKRIAERFPDMVGTKTDLARSHSQRGTAFSRAGKFEQAEAEHKASLAIHKKLIELDGSYQNVTRNIVSELTNLGHLTLATSRLEESEAYFSEAIETLQRLIDRDSSNSRAIYDQAVALLNLAQIQSNIEKQELALMSSDSGMQHVESLLKLSPDNNSFKDLKATLQMGRSNILSKMGDFDQALELNLQAIRAAQKAIETFPEDPKRLDTLSLRYGNQAHTYMAMNNFKLAAESFSKAIEIAETLKAADPNNFEVPLSIATYREALASALAAQNEFEKSNKIFRRAIKTLEEVSDKNPKFIKARSNRIRLHTLFGEALSQQRKLSEANRQFELALQALDRLMVDFPENLSLQSVQFVTLAKIAIFFQTQRKYDSAISLWQKAIANLDDLIKKKKMLDYAMGARQEALERLEIVENQKLTMGELPTLLQQPKPRLPGLLETRAISFLRLSNFEEAVKSARELMKLETASPTQCYNAARIFSLTVVDLEKNRAPEQPKVEQRIEQLKTEGVDALKQAVDRGWKDLKKIELNKDLDAIRDTTGFNDLITIMREKSDQQKQRSNQEND